MTLACHGVLGCRIAIFRSTDETRTWEFASCQGIPCHRNTVYFPKKINGLYAVLDWPNPGSNGGGNGGIWIKDSPDLKFWGEADRIVGPEDFMDYGVGGIGGCALPIEPYEMLGLVPSVCFPCGTVVEGDGEVKFYYGGADRVTALGISSIDKSVKACGV